MKKILSYFVPVNLKEIPSEINGTLEVTYLNGRKILDTSRSNYSYGSLQKILHQGLKKLGFDGNASHILVLGMGAGSIVPTLRKSFKYSGLIDLVEIDPAVIEIARKEFYIEAFRNIRIIKADARDFVKKGQDDYDLIIVDLFIIDTIPEIFTQEEFLRDLAYKVAAGGKLIFNTMRQTLDREVLSKMVEKLKGYGLSIKILEGVGGTNDLILGVKTRGFMGLQKAL